MALASSLAYQERPLESDGVVIGNSQCKAVISICEHDCVVAFQGSNDVKDWLSNISRFRVQSAIGSVHGGMWNDLKPFLADIDSAIPDHLPIHITGHSRGGGQANLFALWRVRIAPVASVTTFGAPNVFSSVDAAVFGHLVRNASHFINESDPVPNIPRIGYDAVGKLKWFDGHEWREHRHLITRIGAFIFGRRWPLIGDPLNDHSIHRYVSALEG